MKLFEIKNVGFKYKGEHVMYDGTDPRHPDEEMRRVQIKPGETAIVTERKKLQVERDHSKAFQVMREVSLEEVK
jgi:hypothetical protein